jgi:hypothetical protein
MADRPRRRRGTHRLLQAVIALAGFVPVLAGLSGVLEGTEMVGLAHAPSPLDSHFRYLSGLLLGIGLAFWTTIPRIERHGAAVQLLTVIVVIGGFSRLFGALLDGFPTGPMRWALGMELVVTPVICLWQASIARPGA